MLSAKLKNSVYNDASSNTRKIRLKSEVSKLIDLSVCNKDVNEEKSFKIRSLSHFHLFELIFYLRSNIVNFAVYGYYV